MLCHICLCCAVLSDPCSLVMALAHGSLVCDFLCVFVTFQCGVSGQVWSLIASIPDLCLFPLLYAEDD